MMMIFSVNLKCVMFCCLLWKANFSNTRLPTCSCFLSRFFGMKCNSSDVNLVPWWVCLMLYLCLLVCTFPSTEHLRLCWTSSLYKPCMFVTEVLLLCVCWFFFFHVGVFAVPPRGGTDMWFPGQRWMYHSGVLSDLSWTGVHDTESTSRSLCKGVPVVRWLYVLRKLPAGVVRSAFGKGSSWINHDDRVTEAGMKDVKTALLSNNTWRCV